MDRPSGKLTPRQARRFIDHAIRQACLKHDVKVVCMRCRRAVKQTRKGRLWHALTCWIICLVIRQRQTRKRRD